MDAKDAKQNRDASRSQPRSRRETDRGRELREIQQAVRALESARLGRFASANLQSDEQRRLLAPSHLMLEQQYFIETDETANFYDIVCDHAIARKSGLYVSGAYRVGKTSSISNAIRRLNADLPSIATLYYSAKRQSNQTKIGFCRELLMAFRYPWSTYQDSSDLLARYMMAMAIKAGSRTCLLFVDEAQMLTVMQMRYLLEIWNELRQEGFVLVTVLVGQEGIDSLKTLTEEEDHAAVVARFFVVKCVLGGLHSLEHMMKYLDAYDTRLAFPDADWPFSRYFCMAAFDHGWRLKSEAERFWGELLRYSGAGKAMLAYTGFRLAFVNDAIHSFLLDSMKDDNRAFKGSREAWLDAVSSAAESELLIGRDRGFG